MAEHRDLSQLQMKIDELQNTNRSLGQHIMHLTGSKVAASNHIGILTRKNQQLCRELTEIDKMAEQLEKENERALDIAEEELEIAKKEIRIKQETIGNLEATINNLKSDAIPAKDYLENIAAELAERKQENKAMTALLDQLQMENSRLNSKVEKMEKAEKKRILASERSLASSPSRLDAFVKSMEEERDQYKSEADHLRKILRSVSRSPRHSPRHSPKHSPSRHDSELKKSIQERDELQNMLSKFERHMAEIQANVKVLTSERDKINALYEKSQQEVTHLRKELSQSSRSPKAQTILKRVEAERDTAISDLRRMTTERDSLRERLKISQETAINERAHLQQRSEELESAIQSLESERAKQKSNLALMKDTLSTMEKEVKILSEQKAECDKLRLLNNKVQHSLDETEKRLTMKSNELQTAQGKIVRLKEKIDEQSSQNHLHQEETGILQRKLSDLHKEKDNLILAVNQKTEKISSLEKDISQKENTIKRLHREKEESTQQFSKTSSVHEQEIGRLRRQLDEISEELCRTGRDKEDVVKENCDLHDQVSRSKVEIQTFTHKLKDSQVELQDIRLKLQGAITNVARLESSVNTKEKEYRDLLENYRKASSQAEIWENKFYHLEKQFHSSKLDLHNAESELRKFKERVDSLELEVDQRITAEENYQSQLISLTKSAVRMEEELRQAKGETSRERHAKLESEKQLINHHLYTKSQERLHHELESSCTEVEHLKKQLASERNTIKNLEALLVSHQEEEFQLQVRVEALESELQLLGDRLILAESKLGTHMREAGQLKNKIAQQDAELELTRRQLSTERFEREFAVKELRHQTKVSPERPFKSPERRSKSPEKSLDRSLRFRDF